MSKYFRIIFTSCLFFLIFVVLFSSEEDGRSFIEHPNLWTIISIFWFLITFLFFFSHHFAKKLKNIFIAIEGYFILYLIFPNISYFSTFEFFFIYFGIIGLVKESLIIRTNKGKKMIILSFYISVISFFLSTAILVPYRKNFDLNENINKQGYKLITVNTSPSFLPNTSIKFFHNGNKKNINFSSGMHVYSLNKNSDYTLFFSSPELNENIFLILQSPQGKFIQIFPQSKLIFSIESTGFIIKEQLGNITFLNTGNRLPPYITSFGKDILSKKRNKILLSLPPRIRYSKNLQKISVDYTFFLAKIFPFFYEYNAQIAKIFLPYLSINSFQNKEKNNITNYYNIFFDNFAIGKNYSQLMKKYINDFF